MDINLNQWFRSTVLSIIFMIVFGIASISVSVLLGTSSGRTVAELWQSGYIMNGYMMFYCVMTFIITAYMWRHRSSMAYVMVPFLAIVGLVVMTEHNWPASLVLPIMLCYLIAIVQWEIGRASCRERV